MYIAYMHYMYRLSQAISSSQYIYNYIFIFTKKYYKNISICFIAKNTR